MTGRSGTQASGVEALLLLLRFHHIAVDPAQILHQFGGTFGVAEILRCAKTLDSLAPRFAAEDPHGSQPTLAPAWQG